MNKKKLSRSSSLQSSVTSVLAALLCILIGLLVGFLVLVAINPAHAWGDGFVRIIKGGFHDAPYGVGKELANAAPLIMTGLSVAFAFKTGLFNIGAAGQYTLGAYGALGAVGGLAYIVPPVQTWNFEVGVAGAGFLALAVMIFGQWKPFHIFGAAMFFAVFKSLANIADSTFLAQLHWSSNIYNMMPFVASMVILAFTSKNSMAPKAEGIPYDKGSR